MRRKDAGRRSPHRQPLSLSDSDAPEPDAQEPKWGPFAVAEIFLSRDMIRVIKIWGSICILVRMNKVDLHFCQIEQGCYHDLKQKRVLQQLRCTHAGQ